MSNMNSLSMNPTIQTFHGPIRGYKAFKKDANGLYTDGLGRGQKTYWKYTARKKIHTSKEQPLELCVHGFHFFTDLTFAIDYLTPNNEIRHVVAMGNIIQDTEKAITDDIKIGKKVTKKALKKFMKSGRRNSGNRNSGNRNSGCGNSGSGNSGNLNSGDRNSGSRNSGYCNSGDHNSGYCNSGNYNSGSHNSGDCNSGSRNSGYCNSGDRNSGYRNDGDYNSGNLNSGDRNSGSRNSGYGNSGSDNSGCRNSGYCNSGSDNSGNRNSGSRNSGSDNSGDHNSGCCNSGSHNSGNCNSGEGYRNWFCTKTRYFLFDVEVSSIPTVLSTLDMSWFDLADKTYKEAWSQCPAHILHLLVAIPEFRQEKNIKKFFEITGINLNQYI